jgi:hypothetical protein
LVSFSLFFVTFFLLILSIQNLWLELADEDHYFHWNKVDLKPEDFTLGYRLVLLCLFSNVFDPGSPVSRWAEEWDKSPARLHIIKQINPNKKLLNAHLQPVAS